MTDARQLRYVVIDGHNYIMMADLLVVLIESGNHDIAIKLAGLIGPAENDLIELDECEESDGVH